MSLNQITARFDGRCGVCNGAFKAGTTILWAKGQKAQHVACDGAAGAVDEGCDAATAGANLDAILARLDYQQAQVAAWTPAEGNLRVVAAGGSG
ncbi:MAG: hypothetical protein Q8S13_12535 [Dehalococcoidia bacterium]|nr:hypothetical protein [Dehalococcoidia bacterium]